jgi:hypothetical protein
MTTKAFDEAYAEYLHCLAKLDSTSDIAEKNLLFKQLTEQLSQLETRIKYPENIWEDDPDLDSDLN